MRPFVLLILLGLGGCAWFERPLPATTVNCPRERDYAPEFQAQLADEMDSLKGTKPAISQMYIDYHNEREQIRACRGAL